MKSDTCREKLKGKREVYRRSDGRQELQSCIRSRISQAANGVHSAVMLYGLAFVCFVCLFVCCFVFCLFFVVVVLFLFFCFFRTSQAALF